MAKEKNKEKKETPKKGRNWKMLDSILFLVIVIIVSTMMFFTAFAADDEGELANFQQTDEYSKEVTMSLLSGTVPSVNYTDRADQKTEYLGWSVKQLLIEDLKIREKLRPYKAPADEAQLQAGIETAVGNILDELVGDERTYDLNVSWHKPGESSAPTTFHIKGDELSTGGSSLILISLSTIELSIYDPDVTETGRFDLKITLGIYET